MMAPATLIGHPQIPTFDAIPDTPLWVTPVSRQRRVATTAAERVIPAETAASPAARTIQAVWNADCSAACGVPVVGWLTCWE